MSNDEQVTGAQPGRNDLPAAGAGPALGLLEWFRLGEHERVERVLNDVKAVGVRHLRTGVSWADWCAPGGEEWYGWLLPRLARDVEVLPWFLYTPPSLAVEPRASAPPQDPKAYADFLDQMITTFGDHFEYVELWNEPNNLIEWDWTLDPDWLVFSEMIAMAAYWARQRGKKTVLGGMSPPDPNWLRMLCERRVMEQIDVIGLHGFPGVWEPNWPGWDLLLRKVRTVLVEQGCDAELWITETGYSTWRHDESRQIEVFVDARRAEVARLYWYGVHDLDPDREATDGRAVRIFDSLARPGVEENLRWLRETHGDRFDVRVGDVRNLHAVRDAVQNVETVFHLAAQVAVTTSLVNPLHDFEVNARGTLNVLESARAATRPPAVLLTSTNKVYGALPDLELQLNGLRYEPVDAHTREHGVGEARPLDFHSPYGCSKGTADQYVLDYSRTLGLPAAVFRMSCIYGPHQFGTEDQGWVAHFLLRALNGQPITIYGDGRQVRDILFVTDLVSAFLHAEAGIEGLSGTAFNLGGGPTNTISLCELLDLIETIHGVRPETRYAEWRPGDQRYYVSDTGRFQAATGWAPEVPAARGVRLLYEWLGRQRRSVLAAVGKGLVHGSQRIHA